MQNSRWTAIFDLDGTLIPNMSAEKTFFFYMLRNGLLSFTKILQIIPAIWRAKGNLHDVTRGNKAYLRNVSAERLENIARNYFEPRIDSMVFPRMHQVIDEHRANGDLLLLLTGTLDVIAGCFVRQLRLDGFRAAKLEINNGYYTGRVNGILPYGIGKLEVLRELKEEFKYDSNKTALYANIYSDRFVMNAVERPVAVNPDQRLRTYAKRQNWKIIDAK
jgi:HAD superfamily hydrolase (TIGR01490 family)